jgi:hypothetical protein
MAENYHGCIATLQSAIGKNDLVPQAEYVYAESMIRTGQIASGQNGWKRWRSCIRKSHRTDFR